jgi:parallel beta-helix repeat protein
VSGARVTGEGSTNDGIVVRSCEACTTLSTESADNEIVDNRVSGPADGILVSSSTGDTVLNNTVEDAYVGIGASSATGTSVDANTVRSSRIGAVSFGTDQVQFKDTRITGGDLGLVLASAQGNVLRNNTIANTEDGFRVVGGYDHDIDRSNTIDGDPIYYLNGEAGTSVTGEDDPGYVAVIDSTDVTVRNVTLDNVGSLPVVESGGVSVANVSIPTASGGIQLVNTQNSVVRDSRVESGGFFGSGVAIRRCETCLSGADSGNNEIRNVEVSDAFYGIVIEDSSDDAVTDSEVTDSLFGVVLAGTDGTAIRRNALSDGFYGVLVWNDDPTAATTTVARLQRNTVTDHRRGVYLDAEAGRVAVVENTIVRNDVGVYVPWPFFSSSETDPQYDLHRNHLDNDRYGVLNRDRSLVVNATGNYWGAADGPSSRTEALEDPKTGALADGSGDAVSRGDEDGVSNVRFDPFLTAPPSAAPAPPAENDSAA